MKQLGSLKKTIIVALSVLAVTFGTSSHAAKFPERPITLVVPFTAGGPTDALARAIADDMTRTLGQPIVIDNKAGGNSIIGTAHVARARPDGYTLLMATAAGMIMNPLLRNDLPYEVDRDFDLLQIINVNPLMLVTSSSHQIKSLDDFIKLSKEQDSKISYASVGLGSAYQLAFEALQQVSGIKLNHIPYKGSPPALIDVMSKTVDVMFDTPSSVMPHVTSGKLRALATSSPTRFPIFPDVPAVAERYPGYETVVWSGVVAPKGLPADVREALKTAIDKSLKSPKYLQLSKDSGTEPSTPLSSAELSKFMQTQQTKWKAVIQRADIKIQ
ncbi:MAG: tripartite tricarboxylate transporter substrate binding protein [Comamonadaceae bacterium]|nr:tripartite tricarboxylate transporter substrate binding protein [Comamonadaceae bacterium]